MRQILGHIFRHIRSPPAEYEIAILYAQRIVEAHIDDVAEHKLAGNRIDGQRA